MGIVVDVVPDGVHRNVQPLIRDRLSRLAGVRDTVLLPVGHQDDGALALITQILCRLLESMRDRCPRADGVIVVDRLTQFVPVVVTDLHRQSRVGTRRVILAVGDIGGEHPQAGVEIVVEVIDHGMECFPCRLDALGPPPESSSVIDADASITNSSSASPSDAGWSSSGDPAAGNIVAAANNIADPAPRNPRSQPRAGPAPGRRTCRA